LQTKDETEAGICRFHTADLVGNIIYFVGGFTGVVEAQSIGMRSCMTYDTKQEVWDALQIKKHINFKSRSVCLFGRPCETTLVLFLLLLIPAARVMTCLRGDSMVGSPCRECFDFLIMMETHEGTQKEAPGKYLTLIMACFLIRDTATVFERYSHCSAVNPTNKHQIFIFGGSFR